jgi:rod shape-determining protein MreD
MRVVLAGLAALGSAVLELSVGPHFSVGDVHPHVVLALGVIATLRTSAETGLAWAFVGGAALDLLASRPLGTTSFVLLIVLAAAGLSARSSPGLRLVVAIGLVPICSAASSILLVLVLGALGSPVALPGLGTLLLGAAYDSAIAAVAAPLVMLLARGRHPAGYVYG